MNKFSVIFLIVLLGAFPGVAGRKCFDIVLEQSVSSTRIDLNRAAKQIALARIKLREILKREGEHFYGNSEIPQAEITELRALDESSNALIANIRKFDEDLKAAIELGMLESLVTSKEHISGVSRIKEQVAQLREQLLVYLDPHHGRDIFVEYQANGKEGDSTDFLNMMLDAHELQAKKAGLSFDIISRSSSHISVRVKGQNPWTMFRSEMGLHQAQRKGANGNRKVTNKVFVSSFPDLPHRSDFQLKSEEVDVQTTHSGGKGGQNVNKVETAVIAKHLPTGIQVRSESQRSQVQNKEEAMKILSAKVQDHLEKERSESLKNLLDHRDTIVRTYDFALGNIRSESTIDEKPHPDTFFKDGTYLGDHRDALTEWVLNRLLSELVISNEQPR